MRKTTRYFAMLVFAAALGGLLLVFDGGEAVSPRRTAEGVAELSETESDKATPAESATAKATPRLWRVTGVVLGKKDWPVADASVSCGRGAAASDAEGRFSFEAPDDLFLLEHPRVRVRAAGYAPLAYRPRPGKYRDLVLRLPPRQTLRGEAVDIEGVPVAGARLMLRGRATNTEGESGADGRFEFTNVADEQVTLTARAEGYLTAREEVCVPPYGVGIVVVLRGGRRCSVLVEDAAGVMVPDARVTIDQFSIEVHRSRVTTGSDGRAPTVTVSTASQVVTVEHPRYRTTQQVLPQGGEDIETTVVVEPGRVVRVVVATDDPDLSDAFWVLRLAPKAMVVPGPIARGIPHTKHVARTGEEVQFTGCRPGQTYAITAAVRIPGRGLEGPLLLVRRFEMPDEDLRLEYRPEALRRVRIVCVDDLDRPLPGVRLILRGHPVQAVWAPKDEDWPHMLNPKGEVWTGVDGSGTALLLAGNYALSCWRDDLFDSKLEHVLGISDGSIGADILPQVDALTITLHRAVSLRGVLRRSDGTPIAGRRVAAYDDRLGHGAVTDALGRFEIKGLRPGVHSVRAEGVWREALAVLVKRLTVPAEPLDLVVPTAVLRGRVTGWGGERFRLDLRPTGPLAGFQTHPVQVWTGADGRFELRHLTTTHKWRVDATGTLGSYGMWSGKIPGGEIEVDAKAR